MSHISNRVPQSGFELNELVADVLSATVLVLVGIIAVAQFAYY